MLSTKYDGSLRESYTGLLLDQIGSLIRLQVPSATPIFRGIDRHEVSANDAIEIYFTDRWYNVLHFLEHGVNNYLWYANISTPATFDGTTLQWIDLDIDVGCRLDGSIQSLDFDEFQENRMSMSYPDDLIEQALAAHNEVIQLAKSGASPFNRPAQLRHWINHLE